MPAPNPLIPRLFSRSQLNSKAWDACVAASSQSVLYAYSWYLDVVLPAPAWKWAGVVLLDESGTYQAVMPIPLRRKTVVGVPYAWVVHQPFFCQFLGVFSRNGLPDTELFYHRMIKAFRYGSLFCTRQKLADDSPPNSVNPGSTQVLDLSVGYPAIYRKYTNDRKANLRRGVSVNWEIIDSTDPEPLLTLFKNNHARTVQGGVALWAYAIFRNLVNELAKRNLIVLRYALCQGQVEAGTLFVQEGNRIIYLFNAASGRGRKGNARTLLIDQLIREKAGQPLIFDFESPEKLSIRAFYQSFGAVEEPLLTMRWNRLNVLERIVLKSRNWLSGRA